MIPQVYFTKVKQCFNGDTAKTWAWFQAKNPALGFMSPLQAIREGRVEMLMHLIDNALVKNLR